MLSEALRSSFKVPELKSRIKYTLGFLALYRLGCFVPVPGVSTKALATVWAGSGGGVFGFINVFSGGALERFSLFSLGIMPYINASIIIQLLTVAFPDSLGKIAKEGEAGRRVLTQWTRIGTVVLALLQGAGFTYYFAHLEQDGLKVVPNANVTFWLTSLVTLMAGTAFLMWIGEQITEAGIGNGISVLIAAGIISGIPKALNNTLQLLRQDEVTVFHLAVVGGIVYIAMCATVMISVAVRKIPIQYAKRIQGRRVYGGVSQFLPLRVNAANVIPVSFAQALLSLPSIVAGWIGLENRAGGFFSFHYNWTVPGRWEYNLFFALLILGFTFVHTSVIINVEELSDGLKRQGGSIPGIRPGRPTAEFIERVVLRITLWGGLFLAAVCLLPYLLIEQLNVPFYFGGTALIIVVGVCLDTVSQMESFLLMRHYEGFMGSGAGRVRGRR